MKIEKKTAAGVIIEQIDRLSMSSFTLLVVEDSGDVLGVLVSQTDCPRLVAAWT